MVDILLAFRQQSVSFMFEELLTSLTDYDVFTLLQGKNLLQKHFDLLIVEPEIPDVNNVIQKANMVIWAGSKPPQITLGSEMPTPINYSNLVSFLEKKIAKSRLMLCKGVFLNVEAQLISIDKNDGEPTEYADEEYINEISLTEKETSLLDFLLKNPAGVNRNLILKEVWGYDTHMETKTVETHVSTLRTKLENNLQNITIKIYDSKYKLSHNTED